VENAPNPEIVVVINNIAPVPEMQQADGYSYKCPYQISLFMHKQLIPIAFPAEEPLADGASLLAMDVGGTKIDAALFGARNGVLSVLKEAVFLEHFFEVGRLRSLLEDVPVYLVRNQKTALLGAAQYGAHINN
jgi:Glucokinase